MYLYIPAMYFSCCCFSVFCCTAAAAAAVLLLATAVRHRVPDGNTCFCGPMHLIPVLSFSSFEHDGNTVASIYLIPDSYID